MSTSLMSGMKSNRACRLRVPRVANHRVRSDSRYSFESVPVTGVCEGGRFPRCVEKEDLCLMR